MISKLVVQDTGFQKLIDKKFRTNNYDFKSDDKFYEYIAKYCIKNNIKFESSEQYILNIYNRIKKETKEE